MSVTSNKAVDEVRASIASVHDAPGALTPEVDHLMAAAETLAAEADRAMASCERGRPFAEMFVVAKGDGSLVWRCTHDPAHADIPWR